MERLPDLMLWLRDGIPITLLIDLLDPRGPRSADIYNAEDADCRWIAAA